MSKPSTIKIDNVEYIRADSVSQKPSGNRAIVVVDRGWIYAGDVEEKNGRIYLTRAVWLFSWSSIGLNGVIDNPKSNKVDLRPVKTIVDIPAASEVYRIPVDENWGL